MSSNNYFSNNRNVILDGLKDGLPIGLGYFAVSFSLGIIAKGGGVTPLQCFVISFLNHASAGEYALFTSIQAGASFLEIANAFDFPGIPTRSLYVGLRVSTSNSQDAFCMPASVVA